MFKIIIQSALAKGFDVGIQKFRDFLATLRETVVKEQEVAISQAIAREMGKTTSTRECVSSHTENTIGIATMQLLPFRASCPHSHK